MAQVHLFFETSQGVTDRLGEVFNSVWANTVAMWTLREQVTKFIADAESRTEKELADRFVTPSGVKSADLRTTCLRWTWGQQKEQFAKVLLFDLCGLYEAWLEDVVARAMPRGTKDKILNDIRKGLQFPSGIDNKGKPNGFANAIALVNQHPSSVMVNEFFPVLKAHRKNSWTKMESMLQAYRYFKECRNKLIHTGGVATQEVEDAYSELKRIDPKDLGLQGPLQMPPVKMGDRIAIELPDVVAFSSIIHRVIVTLDAALAVTEGSEVDLLERVERILPKGCALPTANIDRRRGRIRSWVRKARVPEPIGVALLEKRLVDSFSV